MKIAHIINPVNVPESSDLYQAQPVTFRTMLQAKNTSTYKNQINQYVVGYEEDREIFPSEFKALSNLEKSVLDTNTFVKQRKLPLISSILNALLKEDVDYIIYTNVDIAVLPFFYDFVFSKLKNGSDSLIINRRVVETLKDDASMFAEIGKKHPGYDCFVFRKELLNQFVFGNTCIGANFIGRAMYANLIAFSNTLEIIKDVHVTFHIGDDGAWLKNDFSEFDKHNKEEVKKVLAILLEQIHEKEKIQDLNKIAEFLEKIGNFKTLHQKKNKSYSKVIEKIKTMLKS